MGWVLFAVRVFVLGFRMFLRVWGWNLGRMGAFEDVNRRGRGERGGRRRGLTTESTEGTEDDDGNWIRMDFY
jgi:hypothetical protein